MDNSLPQELADKATTVAQTLGNVQGCYARYDSGSLHITYSNYYDTVSVYHNITPVLQYSDGVCLQFKDGDWVHLINELYRKCHAKT